MLQRALEIAPRHEAAIRALIEVATDTRSRVDAQLRLISLLEAGQAAPKGAEEGAADSRSRDGGLARSLDIHQIITLPFPAAAPTMRG